MTRGELLRAIEVHALCIRQWHNKFLPDLMSRGGIAQLREFPHFQIEHQHLPSPCCCINAHIINTLSLTFPNFFAVYENIWKYCRRKLVWRLINFFLGFLISRAGFKREKFKTCRHFFKHPSDLNVFVMFKIKPEQDLICEAAGNALIFNNLTFSEKSRFRFEMGETDTYMP